MWSLRETAGSRSTSTESKRASKPATSSSSLTATSTGSVMPRTARRRGEDLLAGDPVDAELRLDSGGGGATTELLCGAFALEGNRQHPVLSALPTVIRASGVRERPLPWLTAVLELVSMQVSSRGAGTAVVLERLSEVMLTQALRAALLDLREV